MDPRKVATDEQNGADCKSRLSVHDEWSYRPGRRHGAASAREMNWLAQASSCATRPPTLDLQAADLTGHQIRRDSGFSSPAPLLHARRLNFVCLMLPHGYHSPQVTRIMQYQVTTTFWILNPAPPAPSRAVESSHHFGSSNRSCEAFSSGRSFETV